MTTGRERVGLLGGSFNPIHHGHLYVAHLALRLVPLDRILFIPANVPPHKVGLQLAPPDARLRMVEASIRGTTAFGVSAIELERAGKSFTVDTAHAMRRELPAADLFFLIGSDSLNDLPTWYRIRELADQLTFVTIARSRGQALASLSPLAPAVNAEALQQIARHVFEITPLPISSTDIRHRVARSEAIDHLVPEAVATIIRDRCLYRSQS